jgi:hypothetical protein
MTDIDLCPFCGAENDESVSCLDLHSCRSRIRDQLNTLRELVEKLRVKVAGLGTRCDTPDTWHPTELRRLAYGSNQSCCDPRFVQRDSDGKPVAWTITLNEYQRSNLLWLLCDVMGYDRKAGPIVNGLGTGDWAGEIPNALRINERGEWEESSHAPNVSAEDARKLVSLNTDQLAKLKLGARYALHLFAKHGTIDTASYQVVNLWEVLAAGLQGPEDRPQVPLKDIVAQVEKELGEEEVVLSALTEE